MNDLTVMKLKPLDWRDILFVGILGGVAVGILTSVFGGVGLDPSNHSPENFPPAIIALILVLMAFVVLVLGPLYYRSLSRKARKSPARP